MGYLVIFLLFALLVLSYFTRGRYWCWNYCPRGAFLDGVVAGVSLKKPLPRIFAKQSFRFIVLFMLLGVVTVRLIQTGGNLIAIGAVFVSMCVVTTVIAIILGVTMRQRAWCSICPMGTLQEKIAKISLKK